MMKSLSIAVLSLSASLAFADAPLILKGDVDIEIQPKAVSGLQSIAPLHFKLPQYQLTPKAHSWIKKQLKNYPANAYKGSTFATELPLKVELGMNGTPVLNQGAHGSCVTFATTGVMNATLGAGDYISQLCSLELGSWLAIHDELPYSGWNGSFGGIVLNQINQYGIVPMSVQKLKGCADVRDYPLTDEYSEGTPMSPDEYKAKSVHIGELVKWTTLLDDFNAFSDSVEPEDVIFAVKESLAKGNRVLFGTLLDVQLGHAGAIGQYKVPNDTWMLTPQVILDLVTGSIYAGHEMVVTGYDDNAMVMDEQGNVNIGLFKVRNSWSKLAGDQGDYYISYDHFRVLTGEAHSVYLKK